jgi:hypothetical protein
MRLFILLIATACCAAQDSLPKIQDTIQGTHNIQLRSTPPLASTPPPSPGFSPRPVPPYRVRPVITKADIVLAMSDELGILVDSLARRLEADVESALSGRTEQPDSSDQDGQKQQVWIQRDGRKHQAWIQRFTEESAEEDPWQRSP